jgi:hypothetical protein
MSGGMDNNPTPAPVPGFTDDPSGWALTVERLGQIDRRFDKIEGAQNKLETLQRESIGATKEVAKLLEINNARAEEQIGFLRRKEEREIAAQEASKDAKVKEIEHKQKLEEARWKWWSTDFSKYVIFPLATAIVGAIGAAVGYFFRGVP